RRQFFGNQQFATFDRRALQEGISLVQRLAFEIHLRDQLVAAARHDEMNMRRPDDALAGRIGTRLDGLEPVAALRVGRHYAEALEVGIKWRWIGIVWMGVAAMSIGLPGFDLCLAHWLTIDVQDAAHHVDDLPGRTAWLAWQMSEITARIGHFPDRVERDEILHGSALTRLRERTAQRGEYAHGTECRDDLQHVAAI